MLQKEILFKIKETSEKLEIRETTILSFLDLISSKKNYTSKDLIRKTALPQTHLYRLIQEFTDILEPNIKYIKVRTDFSKKLSGFIEKAKQDTLINNLSEIKKTFKSYQKNKPQPNRDLDQFYATVNTTFKRVFKMAKNSDLKNKKIAFLGDDDLTSVATALSHQAQEITVFEIDDRLNNFIKQISDKNNLNIEIVKQDLRQPIDKRHFNKYDIIFTDPPYTKDGIELFLNQAIKLMKNSFLSRIYLCYGNSDRAREREVEIQKLLLNHNLIIKSKINQFNKYYGAESIGSNSSLYLLDWTPSTKTINSDFKKIYTNE